MTSRMFYGSSFVTVGGAYMPPERDSDILLYSGGLTTYRLFPLRGRDR